MEFRKNRLHFKGEKGSAMIFFAIVVVPLLGLLLHIGVEISSLMSSIREIEQACDRIALIAGAQLPDRMQASVIARNEIEKLRQKLQAVVEDFQGKLIQSEEGLLIGVDYRYRPLLLKGVLSLQSALAFSARSEVVRTPSDVFLLMDNNFYLAPPLNGTFWGNYPPSTYYSETLLDPTQQILKTQWCINPINRAIKRFSLVVHARLKNSFHDRIGFGFFPADPSLLARNNGSLNVLKNIYDDVVVEPNYNGIGASDQECRKQAEFESAHSELYGYPAAFTEASSLEISKNIWGKAVQDYDKNLSENSWDSVVGALNELAGASTKDDIFGSQRILHLIVVAGDVPRRSGERFPWGQSFGKDYFHEIEPVLSGNNPVVFSYIVYQPKGFSTHIPDVGFRVSQFAAAFQTFRNSLTLEQKSRFEANINFYDKEDDLYHEGLKTVRSGSGSLVLRRLQ
jgi:hypothetical protein